MHKVLLCLTVLFHYVIFIAFGLSVILGVFIMPWFVALTIDAVVFRILFSPNACPLTTLENYYRRKLYNKVHDPKTFEEHMNLGLYQSRHFVVDWVAHPVKSFKYLLPYLKA